MSSPLDQHILLIYFKLITGSSEVTLVKMSQCAHLFHTETLAYPHTLLTRAVL